MALSQDYIGGLRLTPDGGAVVVAAADGYATLLDARKAAACLSRVACGSPLRCADTDGGLAIMGAENGQVSYPTSFLTFLTFCDPEIRLHGPCVCNTGGLQFRQGLAYLVNALGCPCEYKCA